MQNVIVFLTFPVHDFRYIDNFSQSLGIEYKLHGVDFQCQVLKYIFLPPVLSYRSSSSSCKDDNHSSIDPDFVKNEKCYFKVSEKIEIIYAYKHAKFQGNI
jgi:hypothetical protein